MLLIILFSVMIVIGIIIFQYNDESFFCIGFILLGGIFLLISFILIPLLFVNGNNQIIEYNLSKEYIENIEDNISGEEKKMIASIIIETNSSILIHRKHKKNLFINWFVPNKICELELLQFPEYK